MPTLPAGPNSNCGVNALRRMQGPVVNDFGVFLLSLKKLPINIKRDLWEFHWHCIVMPIIVTNLQNLQFKVTLQKEFFFYLHDNPDTCLWVLLPPCLACNNKCVRNLYHDNPDTCLCVLLPPCFAWNNKRVRNLYSEDRGNRLLRILQHKKTNYNLEGKESNSLRYNDK